MLQFIIMIIYFNTPFTKKISKQPSVYAMLKTIQTQMDGTSFSFFLKKNPHSTQ